MKKSQRRHSISGADSERWGHCQCLDAVVPTHLTLNLEPGPSLSRDVQLSVLRLVSLERPLRVDRLQLPNSLIAVTEIDSHLEDP